MPSFCSRTGATTETRSLLRLYEFLLREDVFRRQLVHDIAIAL